jgi:hypothetical protein
MSNADRRFFGMHEVLRQLEMSGAVIGRTPLVLDYSLKNCFEETHNTPK